MKLGVERESKIDMLMIGQSEKVILVFIDPFDPYMKLEL
jgi:hypothetical protein